MSDLSNQDIHSAVEHLFRHTSGKMLSVLTRMLGSGELETAESIVQDTFLKALNSWPIKGTPENPGGWLMLTAKNHAIDLLRKEKRQRINREDISNIPDEQDEATKHDFEVNEYELVDDQLKMMFMCCHPSISRKSQVSLTLKTVGGFSIGEIARAFLSTEEASYKLIKRAKDKIKKDKIPFALPELSEISLRIDSVLEVLYLIFNEGYLTYKGDSLIRSNFCDEAIRLTELFLHGSLSGSLKIPTIKALLALMLLQSSRIPARIDHEGNLVLIYDQDRSKWDQKRIALGLKFLQEAANGEEISTYHLQAHIAACHAMAPNYEESDWKRILSLYDQLLEIQPGPIVSLNRLVALSMISGVEHIIDELKSLQNEPLMKNYYLYYATIADFYRRLNQNENAIKFYSEALSLTDNKTEKTFLENRITSLKK